MQVPHYCSAGAFMALESCWSRYNENWPAAPQGTRWRSQWSFCNCVFVSLVCSRGRVSRQSFLPVEKRGYCFGHATFPQGYRDEWSDVVSKCR